MLVTINVNWWSDNVNNVEWSVDARFNVALEDISLRKIFISPKVFEDYDARDRALDRVEREHRLIKEKYSDLTIQIGRT